MTQEIVLKHEFVEFIPEHLKESTIYVSIRFATASHLCCCGCGSKVVTPLRPTDWKLIFDGKTISLDPSIGNWSFACQSHYWIRNNTVLWAATWSKDKIDAARAHDSRAEDKYFVAVECADDLPSPQKSRTERPAQTKEGFWRKLKKKLWLG
jgi:Family of unknown function (DUF6527)